MVYRIRFRNVPGPGEAEVTVEASNPAEAIVKFRHIHSHVPDDAGPSQQVTSVDADQDDCDDCEEGF